MIRSCVDCGKKEDFPDNCYPKTYICDKCEKNRENKKHCKNRICEITVHWHNGYNKIATSPTTYKIATPPIVENGLLVIRVDDGEFIFIPLQNIWHFNIYERR